MHDSKKFSEALRDLMAESGMTTTELAELAGVRQSSVSSVLAKGNPSISVANRYLRPLGCAMAIVPVRGGDPTFVKAGGDGTAASRYGEFALGMYRKGFVEVTAGGKRAWVDGHALDEDGGDVEVVDFDGEPHMVRASRVIPSEDVEPWRGKAKG